MEKKYGMPCSDSKLERPPCSLQGSAIKYKTYHKKSLLDPDTKPIVWVLGGPGCGKFTQCKKIIEMYGFTHLSTGDIIRDELSKGSDRAKCLSTIIERGGLVPNDLVLPVLKDAMEAAAAKGARGYLINGFPCERSQGIEFERTIGPVALILYFEASLETLLSRLAARVHTTAQNDDQINSIKLRLHTCLKHNHAVIDPYGDRVVKINAEKPPDEVFAEVQKVLEPIVAHARAIEAEQAEIIAIEKAKAAAAYARSSIKLARSSLVGGGTSVENIKALIKSAKEITASAEAEAKAAHETAEAAKAADITKGATANDTSPKQIQ